MRVRTTNAAVWQIMEDPPEVRRVLICRVLLVPVAVAVCYLYDWSWLRSLTTFALVEVSAIMQVPMHRVSFDLIDLNGLQFQFVISCTLIDAFCGAVPLLWRSQIGLFGNAVRLTVMLMAMFLINIVRLEVGFIALDRGVPWWLAHECVAGLTYFGLFIFIMRQRAWINDATRARITCEA